MPKHIILYKINLYVIIISDTLYMNFAGNTYNSQEEMMNLQINSTKDDIIEQQRQYLYDEGRASAAKEPILSTSTKDKFLTFQSFF
jgi:hypothetical protein